MRISEQEQQQASSTLLTVRDCLRWGESVLRRGEVYLGHGTDNHGDDALALLLHVLSLPWDSDPRLLDARLLPMERERFVALMTRRVNERLPAAYLTGTAWFCGLEFRVDERVLIPRSPLAELIEQRFEPWLNPDYVGRVLDLCTGSGCIAIASACALPQAQVDASDISEEALAVCRENIALHGLEEQVRPLLGDGLSAAEGRYDLIISNPPYVDAEDMASLPQEYRHEPALALASGEDGLDFTRRLLREAPDYLTDDGLLIVEVGNSWETMLRIWPDVPFFWFEFERGGHGVFMLTRQQLLEHADRFRTAA
ncbi:N5-glutamine S-adenosyl-L-methionine-dependent methyltransferase [Isoalcanivorax pacificus W11-5]|uniref:Ribosomal protein uL3 glutamine methyltransferase n=1 Tax=Isoalcanivorax pacificus W11-5 TaxID=391936 RepID=A0A0B4XNK5_9GAMM|nr:50S ribosomal protein L3 N(5)-glutamine methyltransferase [Isoalcanivorax pacificus]AJD48048.1 N5-glutamine S-adenosyl-L-methionine-dependent methyltransferase [Isoalcanivorax pacificus W11-5]